MKIASMFIFPNGHLLLENEHGQGIELVDPWMAILFQTMEAQGIDVRTIKKIETNMGGRRTTVRPFKTDEGAWNWELIHFEE